MCSQRVYTDRQITTQKYNADQTAMHRSKRNEKERMGRSPYHGNSHSRILSIPAHVPSAITKSVSRSMYGLIWSARKAMSFYALSSRAPRRTARPRLQIRCGLCAASPKVRKDQNRKAVVVRFGHWKKAKTRTIHMIRTSYILYVNYEKKNTGVMTSLQQCIRSSSAAAYDSTL